MSSNRLTKQELRHDSFVEWTAKVTNYVQHNFMSVLVGVAAVAVVVVGVVMFQQSRQSSRLQVSQLMYRATSLYTAGQYSEGLIVMDDLISRFGGTREGRSALYLAGASHLALGENDRALERLQAYLDESPNGEYAASAKLGIALAHEGMGDYGTAASEYAKLKDTLKPENPEYAQAALGEARALQAQGQIDAAIAALKSLEGVEDFSMRQEIDSRISALEALR